MNTVTSPIVGRFVRPDDAVTHFNLCEGDRVADFGAGSGFFVKALSKRVGGNGKVYACEIQKMLVDKLGAVARENKLTNIEPLWCDIEKDGGTKLADGILDAGIMVNILFQLEQKETALKEVARTISSGGNLFVIDWTESFGGLGPLAENIVDESLAKKLVESAGFKFVRSYDAGEHHYGLAFRKV